jgi:hypothetical protein
VITSLYSRAHDFLKTWLPEFGSCLRRAPVIVGR